MSTVDLSERDNKETLFVKEEVTNDAEVFGEVKVDVEGSQKERGGNSSDIYLWWILWISRCRTRRSSFVLLALG